MCYGDPGWEEAFKRPLPEKYQIRWQNGPNASAMDRRTTAQPRVEAEEVSAQPATAPPREEAVEGPAQPTAPPLCGGLSPEHFESLVSFAQDAEWKQLCHSFRSSSEPLAPAPPPGASAGDAMGHHRSTPSTATAELLDLLNKFMRLGKEERGTGGQAGSYGSHQRRSSNRPHATHDARSGHYRGQQGPPAQHEQAPSSVRRLHAGKLTKRVERELTEKGAFDAFWGSGLTQRLFLKAFGDSGGISLVNDYFSVDNEGEAINWAQVPERPPADPARLADEDLEALDRASPKKFQIYRAACMADMRARILTGCVHKPACVQSVANAKHRWVNNDKVHFNDMIAVGPVTPKKALDFLVEAEEERMATSIVEQTLQFSLLWVADGQNRHALTREIRELVKDRRFWNGDTDVNTSAGAREVVLAGLAMRAGIRDLVAYDQARQILNAEIDQKMVKLVPDAAPASAAPAPGTQPTAAATAPVAATSASSGTTDAGTGTEA